MSSTERRRRGYTLVELAMAMTIGTILALGILNLLRNGLRMFSQTEEALESLQTATLLNEILQRDIRYMVFPMVKAPVEGTQPTNPDAMAPFKTWGQNRPVGAGLVFDLGNQNDAKFAFYRTQVTEGGSGLFGIGGGSASYDVQYVEYTGIQSQKFQGPVPVFVLKRTVFDVTYDADGNPSKGSQVSENIYKTLYFRRLVLSLHEAPENDLARGTPQNVAQVVNTVVSAIANAANPAPPADNLYFCRIMVAGVAVGRVRQIGAEAERGGKNQPIDLLVSLIHLDGITERFRWRSLALNWNADLPRPAN